MNKLNKETATFTAFIGNWDNGQGNPINPTMANAMPLTACMELDYLTNSINGIAMDDVTLLSSLARSLWIESGYKDGQLLADNIVRTGEGYLTNSHKTKNLTDKKEVKKEVMKGHVLTSRDFKINTVMECIDLEEVYNLLIALPASKTSNILINLTQDRQDSIASLVIKEHEFLTRFDCLVNSNIVDVKEVVEGQYQAIVSISTMGNVYTDLKDNGFDFVSLSPCNGDWLLCFVDAI
jgi:hypothetical protein